jgi:hypothetical protein
VDGLHKEKVSGVGKSFFCSTIKKYAPVFRILFNGLYSRAAWLRGFRGTRMTVSLPLWMKSGARRALSRVENRLNRREKFPAKQQAQRSMRRADRYGSALLE